MESAVPGAGAALLLYAGESSCGQGRNLLPGAGGRGRSALFASSALFRPYVCVSGFGVSGAWAYSFVFPVP